MKHSNEEYKGFIIQKRIDAKNHCCLIYTKMVDAVNFITPYKCVAGAILSDGSENSIEKAKKFIDNIK